MAADGETQRFAKVCGRTESSSNPRAHLAVALFAIGGRIDNSLVEQEPAFRHWAISTSKAVTV